MIIKDPKEESKIDSDSDDMKTQQKIEIILSKSGIKIVWDSEFYSILEQMESLGLTPDYSCRVGGCHACKTKLQEGQISYSGVNPHLPPEEILLCCSVPISNVTLAL